MANRFSAAFHLGIVDPRGATVNVANDILFSDDDT